MSSIASKLQSCPDAASYGEARWMRCLERLGRGKPDGVQTAIKGAVALGLCSLVKTLTATWCGTACHMAYFHAGGNGGTAN